MGRIKSAMIKRTSKQLLEQNPEFADSFEKDKNALKGTALPSKHIRNKIAGYIARLIKQKKEENIKKETKEEIQEIKEDEE